MRGCCTLYSSTLNALLASLRKRRYGTVVSVYDKSDAERNIGFSNCEFIPNDPADDVI